MNPIELHLYGVNLNYTFFEFPTNLAAKLHSLELRGSLLTFGILFSADSPILEAETLMKDFLKTVGHGYLAKVDGNIQIFEDDVHLQYGDKRTLVTLSVDLHTHMRYANVLSGYDKANPNKLAIDLNGVSLKHLFVSDVQPQRVSLHFNELTIGFALTSNEVIDEWPFLQKEFAKGLSHPKILKSEKGKRKGISHQLVLDFHRLP